MERLSIQLPKRLSGKNFLAQNQAGHHSTKRRHPSFQTNLIRLFWALKKSLPNQSQQKAKRGKRAEPAVDLPPSCRPAEAQDR
jgi:non-homologous end joining protein Ku